RFATCFSPRKMPGIAFHSSTLTESEVHAKFAAAVFGLATGGWFATGRGNWESRWSRRRVGRSRRAQRAQVGPSLSNREPYDSSSAARQACAADSASRARWESPCLAAAHLQGSRSNPETPRSAG